MTPELVGVISIFTLGVFLALRVPVGIAMIVVSTAGYGYIISPGGALSKLGSSPYIFASSYSLSVIPLFVLMGMFLSSAGLGSEIFKFANAVLGKLRGGMAMATIGASMLFSAVSGSAVATATTISIVAVPEMRKYKYNDSLSTGSAAVGGTLGILIPPQWSVGTLWRVDRRTYWQDFNSRNFAWDYDGTTSYHNHVPCSKVETTVGTDSRI